MEFATLPTDFFMAGDPNEAAKHWRDTEERQKQQHAENQPP